jgi:hypothetical protein
MKCSTRTWRLPSLVSVTLLVLACGGSAEVEDLGSDTYRTAARGYHVDAQRAVVDRATAYCQAMDREMLVTGRESLSMDLGYYRVILTFRCLEPDDPALRDGPGVIELR